MINGKLGKKLDEAFKYSHKCRCGHSVTIYPFEKKIKRYVAGVGNIFTSMKQKDLKIN